MKKLRLAVCKGPDCRRNGADRVHLAARAEIAARGLQQRCEIYRGGCYGLCEHGPNVVVREDTGRPKDPFSREDFQLLGCPGEVHYSRMTPEKIARVVAEHVERGEPVDSLRHDPSAPRADGSSETAA